MTLALTAGDAEAGIAPDVGGAVAWFRWRGVDVLRPASADAHASGDVRSFASYPLVPHSNRIANSVLHTRDGASFELARNLGDHPHRIHGLGWQRAWMCDAVQQHRARISLAHRPVGDDARAWPFAFDAAQAFTLHATDEAATLTMTLSIRNADARAFPAGLGWHPFFPRDAQTTLGFAATRLWPTDDTRLPVDAIDVPDDACFDPPRAIGDTTLDNAFAGWSGRAEIAWRAKGRHALIEADRSCSFLVVFIPAGRDVIAIEPVTHMTDAFNRDARGERGTGTRYLRPGESRCCTMRIVAATAGP